MTATAIAPIQCETVEFNAVLEAARAAMPADGIGRILRDHEARQLSAKQLPLVPLLMALLDSAKATARGIADNAWDDHQPLLKSLADELAAQCRAIADDITNATECPDAANWSLPSMSGKELV